VGMPTDALVVVVGVTPCGGHQLTDGSGGIRATSA